MTWKRWTPWAGMFVLMIAMTGCISGEDPDGHRPPEDKNEPPVEEEAQPEPNDPVSGANGGCLDYGLLYQVPGVDSPLANAFEVDQDTIWEASGSGSGVHVEFYTGSGDWVDHGDDGGSVPNGASYGIACAVNGAGDPEPEGEWTYQDGF